MGRHIQTEVSFVLAAGGRDGSSPVFVSNELGAMARKELTARFDRALTFQTEDDALAAARAVNATEAKARFRVARLTVETTLADDVDTE